MSLLDHPPAPNLPLAPDQYERRYQDQHSNVLRLYFNRLSNSLQALFGLVLVVSLWYAYRFSFWAVERLSERINKKKVK